MCTLLTSKIKMFSAAYFLRVIASPINRYVVKNNNYSSSAAPNARVAVVLSGCGVYDGSEIHEASACLVHLSRGGAQVGMFAPDINQMHIIDHSKGAPQEGETRNVLAESARIARGAIAGLSELKAGDFDAVVFPGGFGAAKNLSTFAVDGVDMKVNVDVERVLREFHSSKKPIGLCCIAPTLAAKVLPNITVTVGCDKEEGGRWPYAGTAGAITQMGAKHVNANVTESVIDAENRIVTSPAYMCETQIHEVFDGVGDMIQNLLRMI